MLGGVYLSHIRSQQQSLVQVAGGKAQGPHGFISKHISGIHTDKHGITVQDELGTENPSCPHETFAVRRLVRKKRQKVPSPRLASLANATDAYL